MMGAGGEANGQKLWTCYCSMRPNSSVGCRIYEKVYNIYNINSIINSILNDLNCNLINNNNNNNNNNTTVN